MQNKKKVNKPELPKGQADEGKPKGGGRLDGKTINGRSKKRSGTR